MVNKALLRPSRGVKVKSGDRIFVRYEGRLEDGSIFDRNFDFTEFTEIRGSEIFSFVLGQGQVIEGWEIALSRARLGEVIGLEIPPDFAYGTNEIPGIPANSVLLFTIEIVGYSKGDKSEFAGYSLEDIGIRIKKYGLTESDIKRVSTGKIGLITNDRLIGTDGVDLLTGLLGNNNIAGGLGQDIIVSTGGADLIQYSGFEESLPGNKNRDIIAGFSRDDRIDLRGIMYDYEFDFIDNDRFSGVKGEIRLEKNIASIDSDGDRIANFEIEFAGKAKINGESFLLPTQST